VTSWRRKEGKIAESGEFDTTKKELVGGPIKAAIIAIAVAEIFCRRIQFN
jgi:hypothetical protein